jgi:nucleoside-diphosphate-sugar epimerase
MEKGHELYLFNRGQRNEFVPKGAQVIQGDIRNAESAATALEGYEFDSVVEWIAFTPDHAQTDIELFKGKTKQYIYISSASAYQKPSQHYLVTENTPLENPYWQYSRDKIASEELLLKEYRENGFPVTIVRPSHTYGDTMIPAALNSSKHPWSLVDRIRRGERVVVHGDGSSLWTMTHNTDFAKAFVGLLGNDKAIGEAFQITSDEVLSWNQIYAAIGEAAGIEPEIVHISSDMICELYPEHVGGLIGDKAVSSVFDNSKIKRFVPEFQATVPFAEGIKRTITYFEQHLEMCTVDPEWNAQMDRMVAAYDRFKDL